MHIYFDENGYINGYGSDATECSEEVSFIPPEVDAFLGCYKYENGEYILDENRKAWLEQLKANEAELSSLLSWFEWYDQQCIQYQRSVRLGLEFDKDIEALDNEAVSKAERISQIRAGVTR